MNWHQLLVFIGKSINRIHRYDENVRLFWTGMSDPQRLFAAICLAITVFTTFLTFFVFHAATTIAQINPYMIAPFTAILTLVFGFFTWLLIGKNVKTAWRGNYLKCAFCEDRFVGCDTMGAAFRTSGLLGNLPHEFLAAAVCSNGHQNPVDWQTAIRIMYERLLAFESSAAGKKHLYGNKKDSHELQKAGLEREFERKAHALSSKADSGIYFRTSFNKLENLLNERFSQRAWPDSNRDDLYELLAALTAYLKIRNDANATVNGSDSKRKLTDKRISVKRLILAAPPDVEEECRIVHEVVTRINKTVCKNLGIRLEVVYWENDAHPGFHSQGANELIKSSLQINDSDFFVGILWKTFGTHNTKYLSNTQDEFYEAYNCWKKTKRPQILFYFCQKPFSCSSSAEAAQLNRVLMFKESFPEEGLCWSYENQADFGKLFHDHLAFIIDPNRN